MAINVMSVIQFAFMSVAASVLVAHGVDVASRSARTWIEGLPRDRVARLLRRDVSSAGMGLAVTVVAPSAPLVTALTGTLLDARLVTAAQAGAAALGANVGATVAAHLLSVQLIPVGFLVLVLALLLRRAPTALKPLSNVFLGIGVFFVGLMFFGQAVHNASERAWFTDLLALLALHPLVCAAFGAALSAVVNSANASVAVAMSIAASGLLPLELCAMIVVGANLGTMLAVLAMPGTRGPSARRLVHWQLQFRGALLIVCFAAVQFGAGVALEAWRTSLGSSGLVAALHTAFNVAVLALALPWASRLAPSGAVVVETAGGGHDGA